MKQDSSGGPAREARANTESGGPGATKRVALGVGGGIAAYKSAELARELMARGFAVEVIMTSAAEQFIRPLTFAALTGRKVITNLFATSSADETLSSAIEHIRVAQDHSLLVIAPATADLIAKLAHGLADDFLTTTYLAFTGPVILAPAMNTNMWQHPATQANLETLRARGHIIVEPGDGELACGMVGPGRLAEPVRIADAVVETEKNAMSRKVPADVPRDWDGTTILITAGPTQEPLDAVRYISNRSSGKMGYALAEAARDRGARVVLVSGPVSIPAPEGVEVIPVRSAAEMHAAVMARMKDADAVIKAAAVADYTRSDAPTSKMKKQSGRLMIELDPTVDILAEVGRAKSPLQVVVGFAAETENVLESARAKLAAKHADMIVANQVSHRPDGEATGFGSEDNEVTFVLPDGLTIPVPRVAKKEVAHRILDQMAAIRDSKRSRQPAGERV